MSVYDEAIVIDTMGSWTLRRPTAGGDDIPFIDRALAAGITVMAETVVADNEVWDLRTVLRWFDDFHWLISRFPEKMLLVQTVDDIYRAKKEKKLGFYAMFQGGGTLFDDLALLRVYHRLGLRSLSLTYMQANSLGGGCLESQDSGLTSLGRKVILEMNRIGIAVDLSHVGMKTSLEAISVSRAPVICSHSNMRALTNHPRNVTDEVLKAIAQNGGVVAITPVAIFCRSQNGKRPTLDDVINHIDHAVEVAGIEHVSVSTDRLIGNTLDEQMVLSKTAPELFTFAGLNGKHAEGFNQFEDWPSVSEKLKQRGYKDEHIQAILGENIIRVFKAIWSK